MKGWGVRLVVVLVVAAGFAGAVQGQRVKAVRDLEAGKLLSVGKAVNLPEGDLAGRIEVDGAGKSKLAESPDRVRQAFVFCVPSGSKDVPGCVRRVFVTDLATDETYEIKGEELFIEANRTVENLRWVNNTTLCYERWSGPHFGYRYVVDMKLKKQTGAFSLTDQ